MAIFSLRVHASCARQYTYFARYQLLVLYRQILRAISSRSVYLPVLSIDVIYRRVGVWAEGCLQGAKIATTSAVFCSRKEGVAVGKKFAENVDPSVYASPSTDKVGRTPAVSLRLKAIKPTFTDENCSAKYSAASFSPMKRPAP